MKVQKWIALFFIFSEVAFSKPGIKPRTFMKSGANKTFEMLTANKKYQLKQDQNTVVTSWNNQGQSHRLEMEFFPSYIKKIIGF